MSQDKQSQLIPEFSPRTACAALEELAFFYTRAATSKRFQARGNYHEQQKAERFFDMAKNIRRASRVVRRIQEGGLFEHKNHVLFFHTDVGHYLVIEARTEDEATKMVAKLHELCEKLMTKAERARLKKRAKEALAARQEWLPFRGKQS